MIPPALVALLMVYRGVGLAAVLSPVVILALMSLECWHLREMGKECKEGDQMQETVAQMSAAAFAWMATPPQ